MFLIISLSIINFLSQIHGEQLHDFMTDEEKDLIFRVKPDKVNALEYQVAPLILKCAPSNQGNEIECPSSPTSGFEKHSIFLKAFGENFDLYLEENDNVLFGDQTPVIKPYVGSDDKIKYDKKVYNLIPALKIGAYHDRKKRAAVTVYKDESGRINVDGVINDTLIIRSIPKRLHEEVLSNNFNLSRPVRSLNETDETHEHIFIRNRIENNIRNINTDPTSLSLKDQQRFGLLNRKPRGLQSEPSDYKDFTVYPKILIILDHATYLLNHKNILECIRHTLAYWNVVDLRFREIEKPRIRLNIAGIIVATKPNVTPYMEGRKASKTSRYDEKALSDLKKFFAKENSTHVDYDIVVGVSPWRLVNGGSWWQPIINWFKDAPLDDSVHGLAYLKSTCQKPRHAMALVRDGGNLFDANVAAHEIGHILGVEHDPVNLREDHPDYKSDWKHGYLMSYARINKNQMHWSDLSIRQMQKFLQKDKNHYCLLEKPIVGHPYRKILPGKFVSRDEQCQVLLGNSSYSIQNSKKYLNDCINSYCFSPLNRTFLKIPHILAEGSFCGTRKICIEGECVQDPTDPIVYRDLELKIKPDDYNDV